jgi:hypothetical protein
LAFPTQFSLARADGRPTLCDDRQVGEALDEAERRVSMAKARTFRCAPSLLTIR